MNELIEALFEAVEQWTAAAKCHLFAGKPEEAAKALENAQRDLASLLEEIVQWQR